MSGSKLIAAVACLLGVTSPAGAEPAPAGAEPAPPAPPAASAPTSAPASRATRSVRVVRTRDLLREAIEAYQRSEFEQARDQLEELVRYVGDDHNREAQEVHTYLGFVHVAFDQGEAAVAAFERALAIKPDLELDAPSPKIAAAFEEARRRYRAKMRALDHDPPRIAHRPLKTTPHGKQLAIVARTEDLSKVSRVALNYRVAGNRGFATVTMEPQAGRWIASIPARAVTRPGVEYYVEAWDALGNGPGLKGSAAAPIRVEVRGGPLSSPSGEGRWYRKWWVWALVAGAVATAGGVAAGIYFGRDETARLDVRIPSELDPAVSR